MSRYRMSDGTVVDTDRAVRDWDEDTRFDGNNHISTATGSQWDHQTLHKTRKGRYWIESTCQWQGSTPSAEWISLEEATRWLLTANVDEGDFPEDLKPLIDKVME